MVYLDYNASTPVDQRILPALTEAHAVYGNPASAQHSAGSAAADLIEEARSRVASLLHRPAQDVLFTSGATEAATLGLLGAMLSTSDRPNVVVSSTEHKAVIAAAELGARLSGGEVRCASVGRNGVIDLQMLSDLVDDSVAAVAVMAANNETGVINPIFEVGRLAKDSGSLLFVDATQLVGKGSLAGVVETADLMIFSSHKIYGPKGAGALVASRRVQKVLVPIAPGGGQERGIRGGTHNTPSIVGFGLAAELAMKEQPSDALRVGGLANKLLAALTDAICGVELNGNDSERISNTLNLRFIGADAEAVMASMPHIMVSAGSACQSGASTPSHVLLAMGLSSSQTSESLRISLGRPTTSHEVDVAAGAIIAAVSRVRDMTAA